MRTLIQALKTKELRKKILFVLFIIIVYRIGSFIPTPGVDYNVVNKCMATIGSASQENFIGLVNLFSGGAMLQLSIFALGVMPYITASIVVQLLRVVIPRFEALHKEGQSGEAKLTQYTRYLTIGLAVLQSTTILVTARSGALFNYQCDQVIPDGSVFNLVVMVLIMTGTSSAMPRFSQAAVPEGKVPSSIPAKALTGNRSPRWRFMGCRISRMKSGIRALACGAGASRVAQWAGTVTRCSAAIPSSIARWFISMTLAPLLP